MSIGIAEVELPAAIPSPIRGDIERWYWDEPTLLMLPLGQLLPML
jgi:hypothetical protein